jgi:hypothetical protein
VRNEEELHTVKKRNVLHTIKRRKANWIGHILRTNCLLKHIERMIERGIELTGTQGRRLMLPLVDLKETRGQWKLKENH